MVAVMRAMLFSADGDLAGVIVQRCLVYVRSLILFLFLLEISGRPNLKLYWLDNDYERWGNSLESNPHLGASLGLIYVLQWMTE